MSITVTKSDLGKLEEWLELNLDSHISHKDTSPEDRKLLQEIKEKLERSIYVLEVSSKAHDIHTQDSIRFYLSIISSMATGLETEKVMKEIEQNSKGTQDFILSALTSITNPESYLSLTKRIRETSLRLEELLGPSIRWWIKNELKLDLAGDLKEFILEAFREGGNLK